MKPGRSMLRTALAVLAAHLAVISSPGSVAGSTSMADDQSAMELGRKVLAVREALQNPRGLNAMQAVTDLGQDQRYYVMVRGWLAYQLEGDRGILDAAGGQARAAVTERIHFLEQAIRAIDLE
jgi:hypothetical protein